MVAVHDYSLETLTRLFQDYCDAGAAEGLEQRNLHVASKHHLTYFDEYLRAVDVRSIVVEEDYIDRDFLEDFAAYHVRSFYDYRRRCARLHFFADAFDDVLFLEAIEARPGAALTAERLRQAYRGFIVIKPLPSTVVGRTCLAVYDDAPDAKRHYLVKGTERVDLYGIKLEVETLPFQEQDRDVAACASSALWSTFHATGRLYQHAFPSPAQITNAATQRVAQDDRVLPNGNGLTSRQIADAIRSVQLEPYLLNFAPPKQYDAEDDEPEQRILTLKIAAAAYLHAGIPCLLLMKTRDTTDVDMRTEGKHAVAVTGYRVPHGAKPEPYRLRDQSAEEAQEEEGGRPPRGTLFAATRMEKLYAHDDQVGPFARMTFVGDGQIATSQVNKHDVRDKIVASPRMLMMPLYHKIRIPFDQIMRIAIAIDRQLETIRRARDCPGLPDTIIWDLRLVPLDSYRQEVRESDLRPEIKRRVLMRSMPRFLWLLRAMDEHDQRLFDLLFDPTDLLQGRLFLEAVEFSGQAYAQLIAAMAFVDEKIWPELPLSTMRKRLIQLVPHLERDQEPVLDTSLQSD